MAQYNGIELTQSDRYRFVQKINIAGRDECWEWKGAKMSGGYGRFWIGLKKSGTNQTIYAHRAQFCFSFSIDPSDKDVCHRCDNPICVNPRHLFLGTHAENMRDMVLKGRSKPCAEAGKKKRKLSDDQIKDMRELAGSGVSQSAIAYQYGTTQCYVSMVVANKRRLPVG